MHMTEIKEKNKGFQENISKKEWVLLFGFMLMALVVRLFMLKFQSVVSPVDKKALLFPFDNANQPVKTAVVKNSVYVDSVKSWTE